MQAAERLPRPSRLSLEQATPLCNSKCISPHSGPHCYAHSGMSEYVRRNYHNCRTVPINLQKEHVEPSLDYTLVYDPSAGYYYYHPGIGICMCNDPTSRLNAYARDVPHGHYTQQLPALPGRPWPQWDAWISPYRRGRGKHYGWYYSGPVEKDPDRLHRELPRIEYYGLAGVPCHENDGRDGGWGLGTNGYRSRWGFDQP